MSVEITQAMTTRMHFHEVMLMLLIYQTFLSTDMQEVGRFGLKCIAMRFSARSPAFRGLGMGSGRKGIGKTD